jgi:hypothetical protein
MYPCLLTYLHTRKLCYNIRVMNAEGTQSCICTSLIYLTHDEHALYRIYLYSKSNIINRTGQGYCRNRVSSSTDTYTGHDT